MGRIIKLWQWAKAKISGLGEKAGRTISIKGSDPILLIFTAKGRARFDGLLKKACPPHKENLIHWGLYDRRVKQFEKLEAEVNNCPACIIK